MSCGFCIHHILGTTLAFSVDILIWDENTETYVGVDTLTGWDCKYIIKQGDTITEFALSDPEISILGDYTFTVKIQSLPGIEQGKAEHEFITTDTGGIVRRIFNDTLKIESSLLWETL